MPSLDDPTTGRVEHKTFCRICEALCGMTATTEGGRLIELRPNRDHVLSQGFLCVKGRSMTDVVNDPDRIVRPMRRTGGPGEFEPVSWDDALDDIASRLRSILDRHGPRSYANFVGNPPAFDFASYMWLNGFQQAIGSPWKFGVNAEDGASRLVATNLLYGSPVILMLPDLWRTDFAVVIGANPLISHGSLMSEPRVLDALRGIRERGGRVVVIDPRRTETARQFEHVPLHAGTDAWLLAAILHVIFRDGLVDTAFLQTWTRNVAALEQALAPFDPEQAEGMCGVPAQTITELARAFAQAKSAVVYGRTGTCTQAFGTLNNFLQDAINIVTGNLDREGGWLFPCGPIDFAKFADMAGVGTFGKVRSRAGGLPDVAGMLPSRALTEDLELGGPGRIRALCTLGANPVSSSAGGGARMAAALDELELHFSFDLYQNETNKHAHYILPAPTMYEREDLPFAFLGNMLRPSAFATRAVIAPVGECRPEWEVLQDLARRLGLGGAYAQAPLRFLAKLGLRPSPRTMVNLLLRTSSAGDWFGLRRKGISLEKLHRRHPDGVRLQEHLDVGVIGRKLRTKDKKLDLAPEVILQEFARLQGDVPDTATFRLLGLRELHSHNSWMHNLRTLSAGRSQSLRIHPDDARRLGVEDGGHVHLDSAEARITVPVSLSTDMFPGNVALPHGWEHAGGWQRANEISGANYNTLAGRGAEGVEQLSGMSVLNGIPVTITKADGVSVPTIESHEPVVAVPAGRVP